MTFSEKIKWGVVVSVVVLALSLNLYGAVLRYQLIDDCEANLPRNQSCELVAVPVVEE